MSVLIPGGMSTGSYGFGPNLIKASIGLPTSPSCKITLVQDHIFILEKVFAINSTKVFPVPVVLSSTFALSVTGITGLATAIFVPPLIEDQQNLCPVLPSLPTPIQIDRFLALLDGYTPSTVQYLKDGFTSGFHLDYSGPKISVHSKNLLSVDIKLDKELSAHRLAGPFPDPPLNHFMYRPWVLSPRKR